MWNSALICVLVSQDFSSCWNRLTAWSNHSKTEVYLKEGLLHMEPKKVKALKGSQELYCLNRYNRSQDMVLALVCGLQGTARLKIKKKREQKCLWCSEIKMSAPYHQINWAKQWPLFCVEHNEKSLVLWGNSKVRLLHEGKWAGSWRWREIGRAEASLMTSQEGKSANPGQDQVQR